MYRKSLLKNATLITGLIASAVILSAQVDQGGGKHRQIENSGEQLADTIPPVDNTAGLVELDKIMARYEDGNLYISGDINFYENADSLDNPQEKTRFTSITTSTGSSYEIDSVQTIMQGTMTLLIDKKERTIAVVERDPDLPAATGKKDLVTELREFREYIHSITVTARGTEKILLISFKEDAPANVTSYEVLYDPSTYRIKRIRMGLVDGEISDGAGDNFSDDDELVYTDSLNNEIATGYYAHLKLSVYELVYKIERKAEAEQTAINRFVTKDGDGYTPIGLFKNYELLN